MRPAPPGRPRRRRGRGGRRRPPPRRGSRRRSCRRSGPRARAVDLGYEALAGGADHQRAAQLAQLAEPAQELEVVVEGLAEPDPWVEPDPLLGDAGGDGRLGPLEEERLHIVDDVAVGRVRLHRARGPLHVHEDHPRPAPGADRGQLGIAAQRGDVIDDRSSRPEGRLGNRRLRGVDRDLVTEAGEVGDDRLRPLQLLLGAHRRGPRPGRLSTDVEDLGAVLGKQNPMRNRRLRLEEEPPIGERVGGDVDDAHQLYLHEREYRRDGFAINHRLLRLA